MQEQYKNANDKIHAPQELLERTRTQIRAEKNRRRTVCIVRYGAAAACFCLVAIGAWQFTTRDKIYIEEVQIAAAEWTAGKNFGKAEKNDREQSAQETSDINIEFLAGDSKDVAPQEVWELKTSKINGTEVHIGREGATKWFAAYEKEGDYYYVKGEGISEKEFLAYLQKNL